MKKIEAHLRPDRLEAVLLALHDAGVAHLTVARVRAFGSGVDPHDQRMSIEAGEWYSERVRLEFVCPGDAVDGLVAAIRAGGRTGEPGDGIIFVSPVGQAVKIRSGALDREALL